MTQTFSDVLYEAGNKRPEALREGVEPFRLFAGYAEAPAGFDVNIDVYDTAAVVFTGPMLPLGFESWLSTLRTLAPRVQSVIWKARRGRDADLRTGRLILGDASKLPTEIQENGVRYAINLLMQQDASFFVDTRNLRNWIREHAKDKSVLNLFAYTGSFGVAALAGGASRVVQSDRSAAFLEVAKRSASFSANAGVAKALVGDFFRVTATLRRSDELFDLVVLDPPYFAQSSGGKVDLEKDYRAIIRKARPLVAHGGTLAICCNALFVSGAAFSKMLEEETEGGYATLSGTIDVPDDIRGYKPENARWPAVPAPFAHPTKMALLEIRRKDERTR